MVRKIIEEKLISIPEVKSILDNVFERLAKLKKNPDPFQSATYEYVNSFAKMSSDTAKKIIKMLIADYGMDNSHAIQIVNIDPTSPKEIQAILEKDPKLRSLSEQELSIMLQKIKDLEA
jgi:DNA-directed RNA polymerase subunit F